MLREIVEKFDKLDIYEKRSITDKYCELVFYSKDTKKWSEILAGFLGQAVKPAGEEPTKDDLLLTKGYGGIHKNQTLFKKELGNAVIIAMFWPWQDGTFTTLKAALNEV